MTNEFHPLLHSLVGKTVKKIHVSNSHGEVLQLEFTDGTQLDVCTTYGLADESVAPDKESLYVTVNGNSTQSR